jgi:threonine/homoserine/homoserine lactone efflux protein
VFTLSVLMALIHALMGILWFGVLALVAARAGAWLRSPRLQRLLDRVLGLAFVGFGLRLALNR